MAVSLVPYIAKKEIIIANGDQTSNFSSTGSQVPSKQSNKLSGGLSPICKQLERNLLIKGTPNILTK
jgi:hypothetical protein